MRKYRQESDSSCEAGGVLLGRLIVDAHDVVVDEVTEPNRRDRRGRFFFTRAGPPTQKKINEAWKSSHGVTNYLGEWHTHPEAVPNPSPTDLDNWKRLIRQAQYEQKFLFFVIVGSKSVRAWEIQRRFFWGRLVPVELEQLKLLW